MHLWLSLRGVRASLLGSVGLLGFVGAGCNRGEAAEPPAPPPPAVTVARPIDREVMEWDEYTGRLEAVEMVEIQARVGGFIDSVSFSEGERSRRVSRCS